MALRVGDKVWITEDCEHSRYPWKRELVGQSGIVDEVTEKYLSIRLRLFEDDDMHPVWFAKNCVAPVNAEEAKTA